MEVSRSERGFKHLRPIEMDYPKKTTIRVYESSSVEPAIWLATAQGPYNLIAGEPLATAEDETHAHLTLEEAELLRDQLTWIIDNHWSVR